MLSSCLLVLALLGGVASLALASDTFERFIHTMSSTTKTAESDAVHFGVRSYLRYGVPLSEDLFSGRERMHMRDVRSLIMLLYGLTIVVGLGFIFVVRLLKFPRVVVRQVVRSAARFALVGIAASATLGYLLFDRLFLWFHLLLFRNDLWLLDPSKHALIRAYPPEFFTAFFLGGSVMAGIVCIGILFLTRQHHDTA